MQLRCKAKLHGILNLDDHTLEVKCGSVFCGAAPGIVVIHSFDLRTGAVETKEYKEPPRTQRRRRDTSNHLTPVRDEGRPTDSSG